MWFSTGMFGLIKFDGVDWTIFNTSNSLIPTNDLSKLLCAPDGTLWIGTENAGLVKFDGSNWINYTPLNSPLLGNNVQDLLLDKNNNIWIGCYEGLSKLNGTTWEAYKSGTEGNPLSSSDCFAIDKNGNVWMGGSGGVAKYNGQSWETYYFSNSPNAAGRPGAMTIDDMGKVWIGSDGEGLVSFNPNIISNVVKRESGNFKYSIIPNPNKGIFSFRIDSNPPAFFTLKLVNSSGKILETRAVKSAGINYIGQFNISHMSKGIYFLLVSTDKYHFSEKIVVI
jgi:ligand-binding sensor domain-containing protein